MRYPRQICRYFGGAALIVALAGCQNFDFSQMNAVHFDSTVFVPNPTQFARKERALTPITAADLVDASGNCAGAAPAAPEAEPNAAAAAPAATRGIGLEMSECEVVRTAGPPASVEIGANERGDRSVTMTYAAPDKPIYHFVAGRLKSIERGAEPPPEPVKKKPAPKRKNIRQAT